MRPFLQIILCLFLIISTSLSGQGIKFDNSGCAGDGDNDGIIPKINGSAAVLTVQPCQHVTVSHDIYVKNPTNVEWLDSVSMVLGSCYTNVTNLTRNGANTAFYASRLFPPLGPPNSGSWLGTYNSGLNSCNWYFNSLINPAWGDGNQGGYSCVVGKTQKYTFTFEADISSTCVSNSNLDISIYISDDGVGSIGASVAGSDLKVSNQFSINLPPTANAGVNQSICSLSNTNLAANSLSVGTGSWTVVSGGGNLISPTNPATNVSSLNYGANVFQWTVYSNTCAISSSTVLVTRYKNPTSSDAGSSQSICSSSYTLNGNVPTDGVGLWTVLSGPASVTTPTFANSTVTGLAVGTNTLQWSISNGNCPVSNSSVVITRNPNPTVTVNSGTICSGNSFIITPSGASTYTYSSGSNVVAPTITTTYSITGTSASGCVSSNTAISTVNVIICSPAEAINFDGDDDQIIIPKSISTDFTIEYWMKTTQSGGGSGQWYNGKGIVDADAVAAGSTDFGTSLLGSKVAFGIGNPDVTIKSTTNVNTGNWTHVAATWNQTTGEMKLYVNGILESNGISLSTLPRMIPNRITIGSMQRNDDYFEGNIDELRLWNIVRTQCEINIYKDCEIPTTAANLVANYHFNQGYNSAPNPTVTTLVDATGSANTGTLSSIALAGSTSNWIAPGSVVSGYTTTVNLTPTVSAVISNSIICSGNSTTLSGAGANTYTWTNGVVNGVAFSPTTTASYTVIGSVSGCTNTAVASITVNSTPTISVNTGTICSGNTFTIIPSGANTYTYSSGSNIVTPLTTTSYSVTGTGIEGCVSSNTAVSIVTVNTTPTISVNSGSICSGNTFSIVPSGADTYTISGGTPIVSPVVNTSYSITGSSIQGCVSSNTAVSTVTVNTIPIISVNSGSLCSGNTFTMIPSGANTYTYSSGSNIVTPLTTTTYSVIGESLEGCVSSNTAVSSVTVNTTPTVSVNSGFICSGNTFSIVPTGADSYTITGGTTNVSPIVNTSYSITGSSSQGCASSNTAVSSVTVNTTPTISVNSGSICSGSTFSIVPTGANTYTYSSGSNTVSPITTTSYSIIGESLEGCVSTNTAISTVTVNTTPTISVNSGSICSGNSFTMIPSGANTYTYSSGSNIVSPTTTTSYSIIGESLEGCISSNTVVNTVTVNATPTITVNSGSICSSNTFTMIPFGANTYTYSSGSNIVTPLTTTSYSVIGESLEGCVSSNTAVSTVTVNTTPTISVNSGSICSGNTFSIVPTGADSYTIAGGSNIVSPTITTSYSVIGESLGGCVSSNTAVSSVTVNTIPIISVNSGSICSNNTFTIIPSGANTYTYSSGSNTVSPTTTTSYSIIGESLEGCVSTNTAISTVTVNITPTISVNSGSICSGNTFTMIPSGANTYTYSSGSNIVSPTTTTSYSILGESLEGCISSNTAVSTVTVNTIPTISVNSGSICIGNTFVINPSGAITYTYSSGSNSVSPTTTSIYTVTGSDANTCIATNTLQVTVDDLPSSSFAGLNQSICSNSIILGANTPVIGLGVWSVLSGTGVIITPNTPSSSITGLSIGTNILQWTITNGVCPVSSSTVVITQDVNPSAPVIAVTNTTICSDSYTLTGSTPSSGVVNWTVLLGNGIITNSIIANSGITFLSVGTNVFQMTVSNGSVCPSKTATVIVTRDEMPTVAFAGLDFNSDVLTNTLSANTPTIGIGSWNLVLGNASIQDNSQPTTILNSSEAGEYELVWTIKNGVCPPSSDTIVITINPLLIPQIITPNNDGSNDVFEIRALKNTQNIKLTILNRWGNEVYRSSDYKHDFNGKNNSNNTLADDTYYYLIEVGETVYKGYFIIKTN